MKQFSDALWDGSDPLYAPGLCVSNRSFRWRAPKRYISAGFKPTTVTLTPGEIDDEHALERAQICRDMTKKLLRWWEAQSESAADYGTWGWLIGRYLSDDYSPVNDVKGNTREQYVDYSNRWKLIIGKAKIPDLDFVAMKQIEGAMKQKGRSDSTIKRMAGQLGRIASYGILLKAPGSADAKNLLSEMRHKRSPQRQSVATRGQIQAIVAAADAAGQHAWATGTLINWWFALRLNDVFGDYVDGAWRDGLTWDMLPADCSTITKVISKTEKTLAEPYVYDVAAVPGLRERLLELRPEFARGPVIVGERLRKPYTRSGRVQAWRRFRKAAGVPEAVQMRDTRPGAITEAGELGLAPVLLRNFAQHTQIGTTDIYLRERSGDANMVVELRVQK